MRRFTDKAAPRQAFTLIEILVVVSIIALLISILLPSLARARAQAKGAVCASNQKQLAVAHYFYSLDHQGRMPGVDLWLAARLSGGIHSGDFDDVPISGQLYGNQPTTNTPDRRRSRNYSKEKEVYRCPLDQFKRKAGAADDIQQVFSYVRNSDIVDRLGTGTEGPGVYADRYLKLDRVKFAATTPLLVEEYEFAPMNDGELMAGSGDDWLTMRHSGRAMLSFHDFHVAPVMTKAYNSAAAGSSYRKMFLSPGT